MTKYQINKQIENLKNSITNIFLCYNKLTTKEAIENRNSEDIIKYKDQKNTDDLYILSIRNNALEIFDKCNELLKETN